MRTFTRPALLAFCILAAATAHASPAEDIKSLLEKGKSREAYQTGKTTPEQLGNADFDYFFGIAAIDAGHSAEGVLALERYALNVPGDTRARLELGRGYFMMGEDARARDEFTAVLELNPPQEIKIAIDRYLDALQEREGRYKTTASAYLEAGIGYDDNVNSGVANPDIVLPLFGPVQVIDAGVRRGDVVTLLAAGGLISRPVAPGINLFGAVQADARLHQSEDIYNLQTLGASGGVSARKNENLWRGTVFNNSLSVDDSRYRDISGVTGEWHRQLDELRAAYLFGQYAQLSYTGFNQVRDSNFHAAGGGYRQAFAAQWQPVLAVSANIGNEDNQDNRSDLSRHIYGLSINLSLAPAPKWSVAAGLAYQRSDYDAPDPILDITRRDSYRALNVSTTYFIQPHLSIRGEISGARNNSNLELYQYARNTGALKLRYDIK